MSTKHPDSAYHAAGVNSARWVGSRGTRFATPGRKALH